MPRSVSIVAALCCFAVCLQYGRSNANTTTATYTNDSSDYADTTTLTPTAADSTSALSAAANETESTATNITPPSTTSTVTTTTTTKTATETPDSSSTTQTTADTNEKSNKIVLIASIIGGVVVVLVIVLIIVCCRRGKRTDDKDTAMEMRRVDSDNNGHVNSAFGFKPQSSKVSFKPVPVDQFLQHVINLTKTTDGFKNEFISLSIGPRSSVVVSTKDYNLEKNRFVNILAYDRTRVILESEDRSEYVNIKNVKNDYINANFVDGYKKEKEFIASQGPLNTTIIDFWRLIWQNNIEKIVMVTNVIERGKSKCAYYWPHQDSEVYGAIRVHLKSEKEHGDFVIRKMEMTKGKEKKILLQFHFTAWPDEGAPSTGTSLLELQDIVNRTPCSENCGPILIHCSAGIGRTGTYIAIDYLKKQADQEGVIDVPGCIDRMREDRINMEQYVYIYTTVLEAVWCKKVRWHVNDYPVEFQSLVESPEGREPLIEKHFRALEVFKPVAYSSRCVDGHSPENKDKNRIEESVPSDYVRPYLSVCSELSSNYINAVMVDSLCKKNAFIVTQMPLPHTQVDFWRLIIDYDCKSLLMLNEVLPQSKDTGPYWPLTSEDDPVECGPFLVKTTAVSDTGNLVFTQLHFVYNHLKTEKDLYHIWLRDWTDAEALPRNTRILIDLYKELKNIKALNDEIPLLVHCLFGTDKSGLVCAVLSLLDTIENKYYVDVFNVVKKIQKSRPTFVPTPGHYQFLHLVARDYIEMKCSVKVLL